MNIPWKEVDSSAISHEHYDKATGTMYLKFASGHSYSAQVDEKVYQAFIAAESKGGHWHKKLKHLNWITL